MHVEKPGKRIRELIGLGLLVLVAMGFGLLIDRYAASNHARWIASAVVVFFLGLATGVVRWMSLR